MAAAAMADENMVVFLAFVFVGDFVVVVVVIDLDGPVVLAWIVFERLQFITFSTLVTYVSKARGLARPISADLGAVNKQNHRFSYGRACERRLRDVRVGRVDIGGHATVSRTEKRNR